MRSGEVVIMPVLILFRMYWAGRSQQSNYQVDSTQPGLELTSAIVFTSPALRAALQSPHQAGERGEGRGEL